MEQEETDLYLIQEEKKKYWGEFLKSLLLAGKIFFHAILWCTVYSLLIFYDKFFFQYFLPTIAIILLVIVWAIFVYKMLVYKYFFQQRHRAKFYSKYMNRVILTFLFSVGIVTFVSLLSVYLNQYLLFSLIFVPILSYFILVKYKKLKIEYPPLPHLSVHKALYREDFIKKYDNDLFYEMPLSDEYIQEITLIYYYLNVVLYDNNIELVSLEDDNIFNKVCEISAKHIHDNKNQNVYKEIELRATLLIENLCRANFEMLLVDFFA